MISVRKNLHIEFFQRDVRGGVRTPWKLPVGVMQSFQEVVKLHRTVQMIQTMTLSKVQNEMKPELEPTTDELGRDGV